MTLMQPHDLVALSVVQLDEGRLDGPGWVPHMPTHVARDQRSAAWMPPDREGPDVRPRPDVWRMPAAIAGRPAGSVVLLARVRLGPGAMDRALGMLRGCIGRVELEIARPRIQEVVAFPGFPRPSEALQ